MWASPLLADVERRDRKRALRKRTFRVIVVVIAGIFVAGWLYSPAPTPTNIARSYIKARFDRDWETAWRLTCRQGRSPYPDFDAYAARSDDAFRGYEMPKGIIVATRTVRSDRETVLVRIAVRAGEGGPWHEMGDMSLVVEDGAVRVCTSPGLR